MNRMNSIKGRDRSASRRVGRKRGAGNGPNPPRAVAAKGAKSASRNGQARPSRANHRQSFDRFTALARQALSSGDAIEAENYRQHAEHYLRLMNQAGAP